MILKKKAKVSYEKNKNLRRVLNKIFIICNPNHILFIAGAIIIALSLIPLYFVNKKYKERIKNNTKEN